MGAARTLSTPATGTMAVVDVGGGSTEIAIGSPDGSVEWSESFRIGSGFLADSYLRSDPPSIAELQAVRDHVTGVFEGLETPPAETAVAVGGTATSLRRLVGAELAHETLERGVRVLSLTPIDEVAQRFELDPERVRLLPAGILVLEAVSDQLGAAAADRARRAARGRDPRAGGGGRMKARTVPGLEPGTRFGDAAAATVEVRAAEVFATPRACSTSATSSACTTCAWPPAGCARPWRCSRPASRRRSTSSCSRRSSAWPTRSASGATPTWRSRS